MPLLDFCSDCQERWPTCDGFLVPCITHANTTELEVIRLMLLVSEYKRSISKMEIKLIKVQEKVNSLKTKLRNRTKSLLTLQTILERCYKNDSDSTDSD